ncbi:unnamed protein product [Candidula unifasciata]|uniref:Scavenger receptor class B member 1 n=1 Tax=Candidula unifasciata TaxID=100452 RepID=A0A8S3Z6B8_9EUPU|nr:unnamed protein product [Candidula unifasciata]
MVSKANVTLVVLGVLGVVFLVLGCVLIHVFTNMIHDQVVQNLPLKNGSKSFKMWSDPTSPIYFQVWMYDVVNHQEVLNGDKPYVLQKGPYTYKEIKQKFNVTYNNNGTMNYRERSTYIFKPELSAGLENDTFVSVNLPLLTLIYLTRWESPLFKELFSVLLRTLGESLFVKLSVHDLMWGYNDPFFETVDKLAKFFNLSLPIPEKFGLFYNKNNSDDGLYQIYSGINGVDNFGMIVTWNEESQLTYWNSSIANMINGTDGTIYPPFIDTAETKYLFSSDLCRSLGLEYQDVVNVRGIDLDKFVAPDIMFANTTVNPYNKGFCNSECLPSGLLNASVCRQNAPVIMSMPHFLGCDEDVAKGVNGMHPNREEHQSYIDIEPRTGVAMNVGKKLQINTFIERVEGFSETYNIKPVFFPVLWINESAMISESDAAEFRSEVLDKIELTKGVQFGLIGLGALLMLIVVIVLVARKLCLTQASLTINSDDDEPMLIPAA